MKFPEFKISSIGLMLILSLYLVTMSNWIEISILLTVSALLAISYRLAKKSDSNFDILPIAIAQLDQQYQFTSANASCSQFFGYSESELKGLSISDLIYDKNQSADLTQNSEREERFKHKSGKIIWGLVKTRQLQNLGSLIVIEDITERKHRELLTETLLETMNDALIVQDAVGTIKKFNTAAYTICGLKEDAYQGRVSFDPIREVIKENGDPFPSEEFPAVVALKTGQKVNGVMMGVKLPTGEVRWIRINSTPLFLNEPGMDPQVVTTFSDITDLITARNENRYFLEALQIGLWKLDPVNGTLLWDESMYRLFNVNKEDFTGNFQAWESTLTPAARDKAVAEVELALRGDKDFDTVFEIDTKSKGKRFISGRGKVIRNDNGDPIMMFGVNADVTDQTHAELERQKTSKFLELILQNIPSMIFVKEFNKDLTYSLLNKSGEKLLGFKQEYVLGKNHFDFMSQEKAEERMKSDKEIFLKKESVKSLPQELETTAGKKIIETIQVPVFDKEGNPEFIVGISNDITDEVNARIALERERSKSLQTAKLASLGEMSAGVAHEINNPLAIIAGSISLLNKFKNDPIKFDAKVDAVLKASRRIEKIVNGLRKFSRLTASSVHAQRALNDIANEAVTMTENKVKKHSASIQVLNRSAKKVLCDEIEIEQVLINLINNSIDAIQLLNEKWIKINIFDEGNFVVLQVEDSGSGISAEVEQKLFEPFFTTKAVGQGTGLGLSIATGILEAHGATIQLNRDFEHTCFEIRFKVSPLQELANAS